MSFTSRRKRRAPEPEVPAPEQPPVYLEPEEEGPIFWDFADDELEEPEREEEPEPEPEPPVPEPFSTPI